MDIGIDIEALQCVPRSGLYYYLWNVLREMCQLDHPHKMNLFLRDKPLVKGRKQIERFLRGISSEVKPMERSNGRQRNPLSASDEGCSIYVSAVLKQVNRRVVSPLVKGATGVMSSLGTVRRRLAMSGKTLDVFHYSYGARLPLREKVNVMTLPDLIPRRFPEYCTSEIIQHSETIYQQAGRMDLILTYSEHSKRDIVELLGIDGGRVRVTPLAAHEQYRVIESREEVQTVLARYGLAGRPYILNMGNLEPRKNLRRLLEAFHYLRHEVPSFEHQLVLVGGRGWMDEGIFETIRNLHLEGFVRWLGYFSVTLSGERERPLAKSRAA